MAERHNATCAICGKSYYMCSSCKDSMKANPWKLHTDTSEHYKVFQIIHGLSTGVLTKEEAKVRLQKVDLSDLDTFKDNIKNIVKEIIKKDDKIVDVKKTVESFVEANMIEDRIEVVVEDSLKTEFNNSKSSFKKKSFKIVETEEDTVPAE